ncbi:hypothetical protein LX36DRAFT_244860 [Colletotrichum falcatum]|nr:hypothetical protein LX36DRAFT_244860 [Colletotrichum falcatum]
MGGVTRARGRGHDAVSALSSDLIRSNFSSSLTPSDFPAPLSLSPAGRREPEGFHWRERG